MVFFMQVRSSQAQSDAPYLIHQDLPVSFSLISVVWWLEAIVACLLPLILLIGVMLLNQALVGRRFSRVKALFIMICFWLSLLFSISTSVAMIVEAFSKLGVNIAGWFALAQVILWIFFLVYAAIWTRAQRDSLDPEQERIKRKHFISIGQICTLPEVNQTAEVFLLGNTNVRPVYWTALTLNARRAYVNRVLHVARVALRRQLFFKGLGATSTVQMQQAFSHAIANWTKTPDAPMFEQIFLSAVYDVMNMTQNERLLLSQYGMPMWEHEFRAWWWIPQARIDAGNRYAAMEAWRERFK